MEQQNIELKIQQRIERLKKITRKDSKKKYAEAQFELANIYYIYKRDLQQAIEHLLNIKKKDNPDKYVNAQLNLGITYQFTYNNFEQAEQYYLNVEELYSPMLYAVAQLNLGGIYHNEKYDVEKAKKYFLKVKQHHNAGAYAAAQLYLGIIYSNEKHNIDEAAKCFSKVEKQDDPDVYAFAQLYLGYLYQDNKNNVNKAERYYLKVEKKDNPFSYAKAQCKLGDNVFFKKTKNKLKSAREYYQNVTYSDDSFQSYILTKVMLYAISNKDITIFNDEKDRDNLVIDPICKIRELTTDIQKELLVKFKLNESENRELTIDIQKELLVKIKLNESENNDGLIFERQVAHYTKPEVLFNLLKNKPSDFRLNVVDFMNDPTENQVLTDWLDVKAKKDNEIKTFLASFSFNHNSLNQFRLYGNENNIVGSSVSVVFNQEFFSKNIKRTINSEGINSLFKYENLSSQQNVLAKKTVATMGVNVSNESLNHKYDKTENDLKENSVPKNSATIAEKNITSSVGSLPLFRCLYFDPNSDYISIAKRNKYSFYLEHQNNSHEDIDAKWKAYLEQLKEEKKIATIRENLKEIKKIIFSLKNPEESKQKEIIEKITNLDQLIALALMPISCLVKHAAFEDEDECRMIYITNIDDKNVQTPNEYAFINRLYLNYSNVEGYIEKIYLGPRCQSDPELWITNRAQTLKSNLTNEPIKVIKSQMPLR